MNKINLTDKAIESAIVQAFLSYFYTHDLITNRELNRIETTLNKYDINVDIKRVKSDVYK